MTAQMILGMRNNGRSVSEFSFVYATQEAQTVLHILSAR